MQFLVLALIFVQCTGSFHYRKTFFCDPADADRPPRPAYSYGKVHRHIDEIGNLIDTYNYMTRKMEELMEKAG